MTRCTFTLGNYHRSCDWRNCILSFSLAIIHVESKFHGVRVLEDYWLGRHCKILFFPHIQPNDGKPWASIQWNNGFWHLATFWTRCQWLVDFCFWRNGTVCLSFVKFLNKALAWHLISRCTSTWGAATSAVEFGARGTPSVSDSFQKSPAAVISADADRRGDSPPLWVLEPPHSSKKHVPHIAAVTQFGV